MTPTTVVEQPPQIPSPAQAAPARAARAPKYFEVFGDAVAEILFLRNLAIVLAGFCLVLTIALVRAGSKPPLVVRVDRLSEPVAFPGLGDGSAVTGPEVRNFTEHFTRSLFGWDLYTLDDDINRALAMMTPEAAARMKRYLDGLNVTQKVKTDSLKTKVVVTEIAVEKDTPHAVRIKVRGSRVSTSYENKDLRRETIFEDTLVARKVERTLTTPWGLLVQDWSENTFRETP